MIVIVDYGVGNLASVSNMLKKAGAIVKVSRDPDDIVNADKLLLPGVGHFDHGMKMLNESGLRETLDYFANGLGKPVLGICLGAQILGNGSEEGDLEGLGWISMSCERFTPTLEYRIPHMGWNNIDVRRPCPLLAGKREEARFYFVHSYKMHCEDQNNIVATSSYGVEFVSVVQSNNIFGAQFHPEKSLRDGLLVLKAFVEMN